MNISQEVNEFIASFTQKPQDELIAWVCIGSGIVVLLVGLLLL